FWPAVRLTRRRVRLLDEEARALAGGDEIVLLPFARATERAIARRYGPTAARVAVLPLGIDPCRFHPRDRAPRAAGRVRLLFAAHNCRLKGLRTAIEALALVRSRGIEAHLTVAGGGSPRVVRRLARRSGVEPAVDHAGLVHPDAVPSLYRTAD